MSGGTEYAARLVEVERENAQLRERLQRAEAAEATLRGTGERNRGWMVVRRQRRGTMLANAEGIGDDALVYVAYEDAEFSRGCMSCPRDWDVIEVEVRALPAADDAKGAK